MDEHFERVMDLASQGRFEEARKYIHEADITTQQKARYNISLLRMENNSMKYIPPQSDIPKLPVVSMILGFVLIITAFFLSGNAQTALIVIGLIMAAAIPAIYVVKEKKQTDKGHDTRKEMAIRYTDGEADMNFPWHIPSAGIILTTVIGIGLLMTAIGIYGNTTDILYIITAIVTAAAGFTVMGVSRLLDKSFHGAIMWAFLALAAFLTALALSSSEILPDNKAVFSALMTAAGLLLMLYPLLYKLLMKKLCSAEVEAECVDIQNVCWGRRDRTRYRGIWKYEFDGVTYIHREAARYRSPIFNEKKIIRIAPRSPHNTYMGYAPTYWIVSFAAGFFLLVMFIAQIWL